MTTALMLLLILDQPWQITQTDIFQPLRSDEVIVRPDGVVYILNFSEATIMQFDADGKHMKNIGRKGQGPGEFVYPTDFFYQDGTLYVYDLSSTKVTVLDQHGNVDKQFGIPHQELKINKTDGGWVYGNWNIIAPDDTPKVFLAGPEFESPKALLKLEGVKNPQSFGRTILYNPIPVHPIILTSLDRSTVYVTDTLTFTIQVIDAKSQTVTRTIRRNDPPLPFDEDWANEGFEKMKKRMQRRLQQGFELKTDYPSHFPVIRAIRLDPKGNLVVDRWRGRPDSRNYPIAIDHQGKEVEMPYSWKTLGRMAAVNGDDCYITFYDAEKEMAGLAKMPLSQAETFVEDNPVVYDGPRGRTIHLN